MMCLSVFFVTESIGSRKEAGRKKKHSEFFVIFLKKSEKRACINLKYLVLYMGADEAQDKLMRP